MKEIMLNDELFTLIEAATFLKKSQRTVRSLIKAGLLSARKVAQMAKAITKYLNRSVLRITA